MKISKFGFYIIMFLFCMLLKFGVINWMVRLIFLLLVEKYDIIKKVYFLVWFLVEEVRVICFFNMDVVLYILLYFFWF